MAIELAQYLRYTMKITYRKFIQTEVVAAPKSHLTPINKIEQFFIQVYQIMIFAEINTWVVSYNRTQKYWFLHTCLIYIYPIIRSTTPWLTIVILKTSQNWRWIKIQKFARKMVNVTTQWRQIINQSHTKQKRYLEIVRTELNNITIFI